MNTLVHDFLQVILFEGWMLGFEALEEAEVVAVDPQVNHPCLAFVVSSDPVIWLPIDQCTEIYTSSSDSPR